MTTSIVSRRRFLLAASGLVAAGPLVHRAWPGDRPPVDNPRATDGDSLSEPDWDQRLTITVGPRKADLVGTDDKVLQAAIDYVARWGGGTVHVLPGEYILRNAVQLVSGIRLRGSGGDSILTKIPSETVALADDSDWYDQEITLEKAGSFRVGDGVVLRAKNPHDGGATVIKRTLVARSGNRFKLDAGLRENLWLSGQPTCASLFPLLTSERTRDVVIEQITLDGNRANNDLLDGNHAGCIFLQDCSRYTIRNVETRNYHGDGISFQVCHDVTVTDCHSHDHANLGVHPGSGSQRPLITNCRIERNRIGLFWCWGVKYGLAENNQLDGNRDGISIGHCDTDNVMRGNTITNSEQRAILFRDENQGRDFWPNRNLLEANRIVNNGGPEGAAIEINGRPRDTRLARNELIEQREPARRTAIRIGPEVGTIELAGNRFEGFASDVVDQRQA